MVLVFVASLILMTSFVSAYYGQTFSVSNFFSTVDPATVYLVCIFLVAFVFINFALAKFFKGNKTAAGLSSMAISFLITYGLYRSGFNYQGAFSNIGIQSNMIYAILPFLLLGALIFMGIKMGWPNAFFAFGLFFVVLGFTGLVAEATTTIVIGVGMIIIALMFYSGMNKREKPAKK